MHVDDMIDFYKDKANRATLICQQTEERFNTPGVELARAKALMSYLNNIAILENTAMYETANILEENGIHCKIVNGHVCI